MIITASVRTDIPAWYHDWFLDRIKVGHVDVPNPFFPEKVKRVSLKKEEVEAIIFFSKNPLPLIPHLHELKDYKIGFQITITPYKKDIEPFLPTKSQIIQGVKKIAMLIGSKKIVLRYDPIFLNQYYTIEYHVIMFDRLLSQLASYVSKVVISFIDIYQNTIKNMESMQLINLTDAMIFQISESFGKIAQKYQLPIQTCAENYDLSKYGIQDEACITNQFIQDVTGKSDLNYRKSKKRQGCNCIETVDIGIYNSCKVRCKYCYANYNERLIQENYHKMKKEET